MYEELFKSVITNMEMVRKFDVISDI